MAGRSALVRRSFVFVPLILIGVGCSDSPAPLYPLEEKPLPPPPLAARFDPAATGTIRGRVEWSGPLPEIHSFRDAGVQPGSIADGLEWRNLLAPRINSQGNGMRGAVVYLRKVDPDRSRPWDHPAAQVEMRYSFISVQQEGIHTTGIVHAGDAVEMVSRSEPADSLRARGAAFFTLPFPQPEKPLSRVFPHAGLVELSSAMGNFWARGWLFVVEHPYYVRTAESGEFALPQVPDGTYELVCWLPDWRVERFERDPESFHVARAWFRKPLEKSMTIRVEKGQTTTIRFVVGMDDFGK